MGSSEARDILRDAIATATGDAQWISVASRAIAALDAPDAPEPWNFGEPPDGYDIVFATDGVGVNLLLGVEGQPGYRMFARRLSGETHIVRNVIAYKAISLPPPPTAAEIEEGRHAKSDAV